LTAVGEPLVDTELTETESHTMIDLVLVRHGETFWNVEQRFQGQGGGGLSETGRAQADAVAEVLLRHYPACRLAYASDLLRVRETWQPWAKLTGVTVTPRQDLREIDLGEWTGLLPADVTQRFPDTVARVHAGEDPVRGGGESWADVRTRVTSALVAIATEARQAITPTSDGPETVRVFTHGGPIRTVTAEMLGLPPLGHRWLTPPRNCSVTTIRFGDGDRGTVLGYNQPGALSAELSLFG